MQLNEVAKNGRAIQVDMKRLQIYQKNTYNKLWCIAFGIKALSSSPTVIQGSDPNRNRCRFESLPWMTTDEDDDALYTKLYIKYYCMQSSDIYESASCPLEVTLHAHCMVMWTSFILVALYDVHTNNQGYERFWHISPCRAPLDMYLTSNPIRTLHLNTLQ